MSSTIWKPQALPVDVRRRRVSSSLQYVGREIRAASHEILSLFDQAIVSATAFATAVIIGRMTSPDELGFYYTTLTAILIVIGIQDQMIAVPYMFFAKRFQGESHAKYAGSVWLHHLVLTSVTVLVLLGAIGFFSARGSTAILPGLWALVGAAPLILLREDLRRFMFADLHIGSAIVVDITVSVAQLAGLFVLGYFGKLTLFSIFSVMGGACALAAVVWLLIDPPQLEFSVERFRSDWTHNWAFGKWALRGHLLNSTTPYLMIWLVNVAVSPAAAGLLGACTSLIGITRVIQAGVTNVLTTQASCAFTSGGWSSLRRLLWRNTLFLALTLGSACLLFIVTGDRLAVLVFGSLGRGSGPILIVLAFAMLCSSFSVVAGNGLWAIERARSNFFADIFCAAGILGVAALAVVPFGAFGAALAVLAGNCLAMVVRVIILFRAWSYDTYQDLAGHALCGAHILRELQAVTDAAPDLPVLRRQLLVHARHETPRRCRARRGWHPGRHRFTQAGHGPPPVPVRRPDRQERHRRPRRAAHEEAPRPCPPGEPARGRLPPVRRRPGRAIRQQRRRTRDPHEQAPHQGLRLHAVHDRRPAILRHPLLPVDRRQARHHGT